MFGQLAPLDLLGMLRLSETVSPALTGHDGSLPAGFTGAATLLLLTAVIGRAEAALRKNGVLAAAETQLIMLEADGSISVVPRH